MDLTRIPVGRATPEDIDVVIEIQAPEAAARLTIAAIERVNG